LAIAIDGTEITYRDFMSYNLGAQEISIKEQLLHESPTTSSTDGTAYNSDQQTAFSKVYGSLYQFGHQSDGHENVWSTITSSVGVIDDHINLATGQVKKGEDEYGLFIKGSSVTKYDWYTNTGGGQPYWYRLGRWDGGAQNNSYTPPATPFAPNSKVTSAKGVDPCPAGFRVPSQAEWATVAYIFNEWIWVAKNTTISTLRGFSEETGIVKTSGYLIYPAATASGGSATFYSETPAMFLPAAGYRDYSDGSLSNGGSDGYYWSSTAYSTASSADGYDLNFYSGSVGPTGSSGRADGVSVRCVAD
jgi:uncharacterized protein (TIGR02145 family)